MLVTTFVPQGSSPQALSAWSPYGTWQLVVVDPQEGQVSIFRAEKPGADATIRYRRVGTRGLETFVVGHQHPTLCSDKHRIFNRPIYSLARFMLREYGRHNLRGYRCGEVQKPVTYFGYGQRADIPISDLAAKQIAKQDPQFAQIPVIVGPGRCGNITPLWLCSSAVLAQMGSPVRVFETLRGRQQQRSEDVFMLCHGRPVRVAAVLQSKGISQDELLRGMLQPNVSGETRAFRRAAFELSRTFGKLARLLDIPELLTRRRVKPAELFTMVRDNVHRMAATPGTPEQQRRQHRLEVFARSRLREAVEAYVSAYATETEWLSVWQKPRVALTMPKLQMTEELPAWCD